VAYTVLAIESECSIAPVGAFKMTPTHEVRKNEAFTGLTKDNAFLLRSYQHFRNVLDEKKLKELDDPRTPFKADFLESIAND